jgi:hypothetical protein
LLDLAQIKKVNINDLHNFLSKDHTSFTVLTASLKHILSTNRCTVSLSKNSAKSFYRSQPKPSQGNKERPDPKDDCLTDGQNCSFFQFFNRKEKRLYIRFLDKCEANLEGLNKAQLLFLTLTFNTTHHNISTFTTN